MKNVFGITPLHAPMAAAPGHLLSDLAGLVIRGL